MGTTWSKADEAELARIEAECTALATAHYDVEPLSEFISRIAPNEPPPVHLDPLIELIERSRHERVRAVVSMPPRHAKTVTCRRGLAWRLLHDPGNKHAYAGYSSDLANEASRFVKRAANDAGLQSPEGTLDQWYTGYGGSFISTSIRGPFTGKGVNGLLIIDDPVKDAKEAESPTIREDIWNWYAWVADSRLEPGASVIVIQTRWHEDDLAGRLIKASKRGAFDQPFEVINLPALADTDDLLGREPGAALWPSWRDAAFFHEKRRIIGDYAFYALYQGQPRGRETQLFKGEPSRFDLSTFKFDKHRVIIPVDPAATDSTKADWSVAGLMAVRGYGGDMEGWLLGMLRRQTTIPQFCRDLYRFQNTPPPFIRNAAFRKRWKGPLIAVEAVGAFKAVPQTLRENEPRLRLHEITNITLDKWMRAQGVASAWCDGRLHVPFEPWADDVIQEAHDFTGKSSTHDDIIDMLAHGWNTTYREKKPPPRVRSRLEREAVPT